MSSKPQKIAIKFLAALLKHQTETLLGKDAAGIKAKVLIDEKFQKCIDDWLLKEETAEQLLEASSKADEFFSQHCDDNELKQGLSLGLESLPSVQTVVADFPKAIDSKAAKQALQDAFARDFTNLTVQQCEYGTELYTNALLQALEGIKKLVLPTLVEDLWNYAS